MILIRGFITQKFFVSVMSFCLLGFLVPVNANGSESLDFFLGIKFDASSRNDRVSIAKDMLRDLQQFRSFLPIQKPSELEWINAEFEAIKGLGGNNASQSRMVSVLGSAEFQHKTIAATAQAVYDALECVINSQTRINREMFCWSVASFNITDSVWTDGIPILIRTGRLPNEVLASKKQPILFNPGTPTFFSKFGRSILEFIVIPYLGGRIQE
jgi:hypothetical protein